MVNKSDLFGKREKYIKQSISAYRHNHPGASWKDIENLRQKLELEATRVFPMINESIVKERKKRAVSTFIISVALGVVFAILTGVALLAPIISAIIGAVASVATTDVSYNARVKGAFDSVVALHEQQSLQQLLQDDRSETEKKVAESEVSHSKPLRLVREGRGFVERLHDERKGYVHSLA